MTIQSGVRIEKTPATSRARETISAARRRWISDE